MVLSGGVRERPPRPAWRRALVVLTLCMILAAGVIWAAVQLLSSERVSLTLTTGLPGGVYHSLGEAMEEATAEAQVQLIAESSPASVANLELIADGSADLGFSLSDVADLAVAGEEPFDQPLPIQAVARMYDNHTHLVVPADSPIVQLGQLNGTTVSLGSEGSGTELMSRRLLEVSGLEEGDDLESVSMDLLESVEALEEGSIDGFFWSGALPTAAVSDLAERTPIRLVDLSEWVAPLTERYGAHYSDVPVPNDSYSGVPGVRTIGVSSLLIVRSDVPAETIEELTAELFGLQRDLVRTHPAIRQLSERTAVSTQPVPLHPGAVEYYHRAKVGHRAAESEPEER